MRTHTEQEVRAQADMHIDGSKTQEMLTAYADLLAQPAAVPDATQSTLLILRDSFHTIQANHGAIWDCTEQIALIEELLDAAPQPVPQPAAVPYDLAEPVYIRELCRALDAITDFAGTVGGSSSWWEEIWNPMQAELDTARAAYYAAAPQPAALTFLAGGARYKVTFDARQQDARIYGLPKELNGRWVALIDATDDSHMQPSQAEPQQVGWLYTLEYGTEIVNRKISLDRLRYPFGVCGADYARENKYGMSYVRETPIYQSPGKKK